MRLLRDRVRFRDRVRVGMRVRVRVRLRANSRARASYRGWVGLFVVNALCWRCFKSQKWIAPRRAG